MRNVVALAESCDRLVSLIDSASHLREALTGVDRHYQGIIEAAAVASQSSGTSLNQSINKLQQLLQAAAQTVDKIEQDEVFGDLREISRRLEASGEHLTLALPEPAFRLLNERLGAFKQALVAFHRKNKNHEVTMLIVVAGHEARLLVSQTKDLVAGHREYLYDIEEVPEGFVISELAFGSEPTAVALQAKLRGLSEIYTLACELLEEPEAADTLLVFGVQQGSTWLKMAGKAAQLGIVLWTLQAGAAFGSQHFTRQGKLTKLQNEAAALRELIEIDDRLRARGDSNPESAARIEAAGRELIRKGSALLQGESIFMLDGVEFIYVGLQAERPLLSPHPRQFHIGPGAGSD